MISKIERSAVRIKELKANSLLVNPKLINLDSILSGVKKVRDSILLSCLKKEYTFWKLNIKKNIIGTNKTTEDADKEAPFIAKTAKMNPMSCEDDVPIWKFF
ncbi:MAG: hypothetical protein ACP5G8_08610 [Athalassotoga sp.]